jgi:hypothetical protein
MLITHGTTAITYPECPVLERVTAGVGMALYLTHHRYPPIPRWT